MKRVKREGGPDGSGFPPARAALDGLKDYGRATKVQLVALIDRGHRELPIDPNYVGKAVPTSQKEEVKVEVLEMDGADRVIIK